jgi:predicted amidohydrolase YtcJ
VGTLERGKYADLVLLAADPTTVPARDLPRVAVLQTIVGGRPVHGDGPVPRSAAAVAAPA